MKRALVLAILVAVGFFGLRRLVVMLASDRTQILWLLEDMEEGYDEARVGPCVAGIAADWRHEGAGSLDRETLKGYLLRSFLQDRESASKAFLYRVDVPEESIELEVDGDRATLACDARFERLRAGAWQPDWELHLRAELERIDGRWRIVRSSHENRSGSRPGR